MKILIFSNRFLSLFMKQKIAYYKAFTLLEVIIAMTLFFVIVTVVTGFFIEMVKVKWWQEARQNLTQESYFLMEKLQTMSRNYSIDYEEYFNRQQVWCANLAWPNFSRDVGTWWYCPVFTAYGNQSSMVDIGGSVDMMGHHYYYCSSKDATPSGPPPTLENGVYRVQDNIDRTNDAVCARDASQSLLTPWVAYQSYGQYALQFIDIKDDVDLILGALHDDDDKDMGMGPIAITWSTAVPELYLLSHDGQHRMYMRRKLIEEWDRDRDGVTGSTDNEKLYTLQVLQLRGFDAGVHHDFSVSTSSWVYDGQIDTWACDLAAWFICAGADVWWAYSWFHLPIDGDDGWVNFLPSDITLSDRNITISPSKDPHLARAEDGRQISPFMTIQYTTKLYAKNRISHIPATQMDLYSMRLQTTLSLPQL